MDINFDKLAIAIIDEFESDREYSGRDEIVKGMEYVLNKYTSEHDREIIDQALQRAVMLSNAVTKVKIKIGENEEERTVAETINMKNNSMMFKRQMLDRMQQQLSQAQAKTNKENEILESKSENYVTGLFGQKEGKTSTDEVTKAKQQYIDLNTWALIDPINVQNKIRVLSDEISSFEAEVDSVLSTSNALTTVTIEY